jgi:hypothetical protein
MTAPESWQKNALGVAQAFLAKPLEFKIINACGGGDQDWACIELEADAVCKNGAQNSTENNQLSSLPALGNFVDTQSR